MIGRAIAYEILTKRDPHPNPPHKGEGMLPRAFPDAIGRRLRQFAALSGYERPPPPVGRG
ncbi:MAG: hypothetical protein EOR74_29510 [Mesorhizobium sp.]|nr:MAG: hypothetical protein EOR74_29510 [Mesorhizobium sp.]